MRNKLWKVPAPYPNQAPGSAFCDAIDDRYQRSQSSIKVVERTHNLTTENEIKDEEIDTFFCWRCGNSGPKTDFIMTAKQNAEEPTVYACRTGIGCFSYDAI